MSYLKTGLIIFIGWMVLYILIKLIFKFVRRKPKDPYFSEYYGR